MVVEKGCSVLIFNHSVFEDLTDQEQQFINNFQFNNFLKRTHIANHHACQHLK